MQITTQSDWFTEAIEEDGVAFSLKLKHAKKLHEEQTPFQKIEVYDTATFGKLMVIDGCTMVSTRDNFIYHEMMAHPVLFNHPNPEHVCIIGGGDCGTLREVLKHDCVKSAIQIDIDEAVTRVSEQFFPELCESNQDPRATLAFEDGIKWIQHAPAESLDVIIVDSTDPVGPGAVLFSAEFYQSCWKALRPNGLIIQQSESPLLHHERIIKPMIQRFEQAAYQSTQTILFPQVIYPSGWWSATMALKAGVGSEIVFNRQAESENLAFKTIYYNSGIHKSSGTLPTFML